MGLFEEYSFPRYLAAKKSVDDRALNRGVWQVLADNLPTASAENPLRVLEIGAGIGTMFERMLEWKLLTDASYTALDAESENIASASRRLPAWANENGFLASSPQAGLMTFQAPTCQAILKLETADLFDFIARNRGGRRWDLLVAHAFLDLMDIPATLPLLFELLEPGGLFYFTLNFDGATLFEPTIDPALDEQIQALYHQTMDLRLTAGKPSGDSRAGRRLFAHLKSCGARILQAGASDWVVFPGTHGYPADEAYFLHFIIHTIEQALAGHPGLDASAFRGWVSERHAQILRGELVYIAHQLDFVGVT